MHISQGFLAPREPRGLRDVHATNSLSVFVFSGCNLVAVCFTLGVGTCSMCIE